MLMVQNRSYIEKYAIETQVPSSGFEDYEVDESKWAFATNQNKCLESERLYAKIIVIYFANCTLSMKTCTACKPYR